MVPQVFPIITAVNGTIGSLNTIKGWIAELIKLSKDYKDAAETLWDLELDLVKTRAKLDIWMDFWGVKAGASERYQKELWGKRGEVVEQQIKSIKRVLGSVCDDLEPLVRGFDESHKLVFVTSTAPRIQEYLSRAREQCLSLQELSVEAYTAKHGIPISDARLTDEQKNDARSSAYVDMAVDARLSSRGLYESCFEASKYTRLDSIKLEMDLSREERGIGLEAVSELNDIIIHFHFLVNFCGEIVELFVEGPFPADEASQALQQLQGNSEFFHAITEIVSHKVSPEYESCPEKLLKFRIQYAPEKSWFRSRTPSLTERIPADARAMTSVASMLYDLNTSRPPQSRHGLPFAQRVSLAFKIVECGLLLSGTTWLSNLSSVLIECSPKTDSSHYFVFKTDATKTKFNEDDRKRLAAHIFKIGILLAEIGTGQIIRPEGRLPPTTTPAPGSTRMEWKEPLFLLHEPGKDPKMVERKIRRRSEIKTIILDQGFGNQYADAVTYCLEDKRKEHWRCVRDGTAVDPDAVYKKALTEYYLSVYKPMQELAGMDLEEMDWD